MPTRKPSPAQIKLLRQLTDGTQVRTWYAGGASSSRLVFTTTGWGPPVHSSTIWAAYKAGWLAITKEDWRERVYKLTDAGRALVTEKGQ